MRVGKRRRTEGKTDYRKRIELLKGERPRIVFRKSNKYVIAQYVTSIEAQDEIGFGITSKDLLKYGWPKEASLKSIPASYLTGFLVGKKIIDGKFEHPVPDLGMLRVLHGTKVYAFLKGLIDSGIKVNCDEKFFPSEDRIKGKHMKKDFSKTFDQIKSKIEEMKNG